MADNEIPNALTSPFTWTFDKFLLAVESHDLSEAEKSIIKVPSFSILQNLFLKESDSWYVYRQMAPLNEELDD